MLQIFNDSSTQTATNNLLGNPSFLDVRKYVYVTDLMMVTGLGKYQAGEYFRKIKIVAGLAVYVRSIHLDTFLKNLGACPSLNHITLDDMKNAMAKLQV